jgi:uncharacterized protein
MAEILFDRVTEVSMYPIKSCAAATVGGETPRSLEVGVAGFEVGGIRDRDFVIYDPQEEAMVTQRGWNAEGYSRYPGDRALATVKTDIRSGYLAVDSQVGELIVPACISEDTSRKRTLNIFGKELRAIEQGAEAADYFSELLKREVVLVRSDRDEPRLLPERYRREGATNQVAGADGMPFSLTSRATLDALHELEELEPGKVPMDRYRPNIVIDGTGLGAFGEDYLQGLSIGRVGAWAVKACSRCPIPNIDQQSGLIAGKALRLLRSRNGVIFTGETGVFFGQNLVHKYMPGQKIKANQPIAVSRLADRPNVMVRSA